MIEQFLKVMRVYLRLWYPVFRWFGRTTGQEEYVERAIEVTEDNFERILEGNDE